MRLPDELVAAVRERAADRCQYCLIHQCLQGASFHIEHILPQTKGGSSTLANLALACPSCNLHKADRTHAMDPESGVSVPLFHPVRQSWSEHGRGGGGGVEGLTPIGRATVAALDFNHQRRRSIRVAEQRLLLNPPDVE
jgi:hypothetical protein